MIFEWDVVGPDLACSEQGRRIGGLEHARCIGSLRAVASGTRLRGRSRTPHIDSRHELHTGHATGDRWIAVRRCARRIWLSVRALGARNICRDWLVGPRHVVDSGIDAGEAPGRHLSHLAGRDHVAFGAARRRTNGTEAMALAMGSTWGLRPGAVVQRPQPEGRIGLSHLGTAVPHVEPPHRATDRDACDCPRGRRAGVAAVLDVCGRRCAHGDRHTSIPTWDESSGGSRAGRSGGSNGNGELSPQGLPRDRVTSELACPVGRVGRMSLCPSLIPKSSVRTSCGLRGTVARG